jgi:hypothetical protein
VAFQQPNWKGVYQKLIHTFCRRLNDAQETRPAKPSSFHQLDSHVAKLVAGILAIGHRDYVPICDFAVASGPAEKGQR